MARTVQFANNAVSTLAAGITNVATSCTVAPGDGAKFPALSGGQYFMATLVKATGETEVVKVTARTTDTFTIARAQEQVAGAATAYSFSAGDRIEMRLTAGTLGGEIDRLDTDKFDKAGGQITGSVGLGVPPNNWTGISNNTLETSSYALLNIGLDTVYFAQNVKSNGDGILRYKNAFPASFYQQAGGAHIWQVAPPGVAGNPISFTQAMTLDESGNLIMGAGGVPISGRIQLQKYDVTGGDYLAFVNRGTNATHIGTYDIGGIYASGYRDISDPAYIAGITFERTDTNGGASSAGSIVFRTDNVGASTKAGAAERARFDPFGNLIAHSSVTGYWRLPRGNIAQRPAGADGMVRYNNETLQFEGYKNGAWGNIGGGATGAPGNSVFYENDQTVTADYTITSGKNAMSAGPITIASGVTVTVPSGSEWTVV